METKLFGLNKFLEVLVFSWNTTGKENWMKYS